LSSINKSLPFNDKRYLLKGMIKSFRCKDTQRLFESGKTRRFYAIKAAERKVIMLEASEVLAKSANRI
jgi:hypothetical protein